MMGGNGEECLTFDNNEGKLDPEGNTEDALVTEVDTQALVLRADEYGRDYITGPGNE